jgi:uncharacterized protein with HEPN domain
MPHKKNDFAYIFDMLQAAKLVREFSIGQSVQNLLDDNLRRSAIERQIEIVGEAANRVCQEFRKQHPEIPWRQIISQRHIIAHEYDELICEMLWNVATTHIPLLIEQLERILPSDIPEVDL